MKRLSSLTGEDTPQVTTKLIPGNKTFYLLINFLPIFVEFNFLLNKLLPVLPRNFFPLRCFPQALPGENLGSYHHTNANMLRIIRGANFVKKPGNNMLPIIRPRF